MPDSTNATGLDPDTSTQNCSGIDTTKPQSTENQAIQHIKAYWTIQAHKPADA